jgi:methylphosphotriester-DNA--protein-cysteine methyltransferase
VGDTQTGRFCLPACRAVRGLPLSSLQRFRAAAAAHASGFKPCEACRPATVAV